MKRTLSAISAAILLALAAPGFADDKITLALKLEKGAAYDVELSTKVNQSTTINKSELKNNTSTELTARMAVEEVTADGVMTVRVTYKTLKLELEAPTSKMSGDSANTKGASPADKMCAAMVGKSFTMDLDPMGNVKKMGGVKELVEGVADFLANEWGQSKIITISQMAPFINETALAQQFGAALRIFPDHPVAVGETWTIKIPAGDEPIPINSESTLKLAAKNANATISRSTTMASPTDHKRSVNGEIVVINVKGSASATMEVDLKTGMTLKSSSTSQLGGTMNISSPDLKTSDQCVISVKSMSEMNVKPAK